MDFVLVGFAAAVAAGLTLFSGFGMGTLLLPAFALFLPINLAIVATAVVHGMSSFFKVWLFGRSVDSRLVLRFGLPALAAALVGVYVLKFFAFLPEITSYSFLGRDAIVTPLKCLIACLMIIFAVLEVHANLLPLRLGQKYLLIGGILSGFFGGLAGHQGALRAAFLARLTTSPARYIGTSAAISTLIDAVRLVAYSALLVDGQFGTSFQAHHNYLILAGVLGALSGAYLGSKWVARVTMKTVRYLVAILLLVIALLLGVGLL